MEFRIDAQLPATAAQLWAIFFDVQRVAGLIPGCENVAEGEPFKEYSAVMKQRIGPFKLEAPTRISVESYTPERHVALRATGRDKFTGTTIEVKLKVDLDEQINRECQLGLDAQMQVAGRLASLGYPIVKKRAEELFAEFEKRLRDELAQLDAAPAPQSAQPMLTTGRPATANATKAAEPAPETVVAAPAQEASPMTGTAAPDLQGPLGRFALLWPRTGISVVVGAVVAYCATVLGESPWWWLVAPALGLVAGIGRKDD
jgi:carbon monoxide dehydrogenase subunit G